MAAERPHIVWPVKLSGSSLLAAEQDSDADVATCVATIMLWPEGTRESLPSFGCAGLLFESGGPNLAAIRSAVARSEPRASSMSDRLAEPLMRGGVVTVIESLDTIQGTLAAE